jgi:hypothetical protein
MLTSINRQSLVEQHFGATTTTTQFYLFTHKHCRTEQITERPFHFNLTRPLQLQTFH